MSALSATPQRIKIAVVGDVHHCWDPLKDKLALDYLKPDLVLFVGDFGEEDLELVKSVNDLDRPKLIILGNHDAWYSSYAKKSEILTSAAKQQLDLLGETHVGYSLKEYSNLELSVCGSRPFSWGGTDWTRTSSLFSELFGVKDSVESASKIFEVCKNVSKDNLLILIGHNGPKGLGDFPEAICGKDWRFPFEPIGGDFGDSDFQLAIEMMRNENINPRLVIFGHMHHLTKAGKKRILLESDSQGTMYVNSAVVPRIRNGKTSHSETSKGNPKKGLLSSLSLRADKKPATDHHFVIIELEQKEVMEIYDVWIQVGKEGLNSIKEVERWVRFVKE